MKFFIIFDLGETLINFNKEGLWHASLKETYIPSIFQYAQTKFPEKELDFGEFKKIAYEKIAISDKNKKHIALTTRVKEILLHFDLSHDANILEDLMWLFLDSIEGEASLYPESLQVLRELKTRGHALGLFSDTPWQSPGYLFDKLLEKRGMNDFFDVLLYSGDIEQKKPDPQVLEQLWDKIEQKIPKERVIYIGNAEKDILVAHRFKIPGAWVNRKKDEWRMTEFKPTYEMTTLLDLLNLF